MSIFTIDDVSPEQREKWYSVKSPNHHKRKKPVDKNGLILNGIYEDNSFTIPIRSLYIDGVCYQIVTKHWVESDSPDKPLLAEAPWGSYPEHSQSPKKAQ